MSVGGSKRKIAVLGGGQAALTAVFQLTNPANPVRNELDITVYQLGWRLGGKGATGRPKDEDERWAHHRIEEHGLHNWFGFYDNSFRQMRACYAELGRRPGAPVATFDEAFEGANEAVFIEYIEGQPRLWTIENLTNDAQPGEGGMWLDRWQYVEMALEAIERLLAGGRVADAGRGHPALVDVRSRLRAPRLETAGDLLGVARTLVHEARRERRAAGWIERVLGRILRALGLGRWARWAEGGAAETLCWVLGVFMSIVWEAVHRDIETAAKDEERRLWIQSNLAYACIVGAVRDRVIERGFDVINDLDFREWITKHAFDDGGVMLRSPTVEAIYTASFAYPGGDSRVPPGGTYAPAEEMEAGTALRGFVRTAFGYKGSFAYRFRAGTADTCYAPVYEVLKRRGVKFKFFHRVERLELVDGRIGRIVVAEQARLSHDEYEPLMNVDGLPCWPGTPHWEKLVDGDWFRSVEADFECPSAEVRAREQPVVLEAGGDFDDVVLAISIAALPSICGDLIEATPAWAEAVERVKTVRTQALQVWLDKQGAQLGFSVPGLPIVTWLYDAENPLNVWGDYTELLRMEGWPPDATPDLLGYFCSTMPDEGEDPFEPFPDQAAANERVRANAVELLDRGIGTLLPEAVLNGGFDWSLLVDQRPQPGTGADRLQSQYYRANVIPTERYVLSVKGSSLYRLPVRDEQFSNLYLAGDWTQCTLNCGCMEAATMSGMLCANAVCGYPPRADIVGIDF